MWCDERQDKTFEQAINRLGEPVSALVALSDEDGHPAGLVEVIVVVALVIFASIPHISLHDDKWSATVKQRKGERPYIAKDKGAPL